MVSDRTKLKAVTYGLGFIGLVLSFYLWYLVLVKIQATDYMWFIWFFQIVFTVLVYALREGVLEIEKRVKRLEDMLGKYKEE